MNSQDDFHNIGIEIGITIRQWRARMDERLAPLGLTQAKWVPLRYLSHAGGSLPQRKLLDRVGIEGPSLVRILDELERLGLIERQSCSSDRRTNIICLTERVKPMIDEIEKRSSQLRNEIFNGISGPDIAVFRKVLTRISHNLEKEV
jgi:MarR family transcriptional regulator for hemolysin